MSGANCAAESVANCEQKYDVATGTGGTAPQRRACKLVEGWSVRMPATTLTGKSINGGTPVAVTLATRLKGNDWLVGAIDNQLKMVQIRITSATSYDWLGTRYNTSPSAACQAQATFTASCFSGTNPGANTYPVSLSAGAPPLIAFVLLILQLAEAVASIASTLGLPCLLCTTALHAAQASRVRPEHRPSTRGSRREDVLQRHEWADAIHRLPERRHPKCTSRGVQSGDVHSHLSGLGLRPV